MRRSIRQSTRALQALLIMGLVFAASSSHGTLQWETTELALAPALGQGEAEAVFVFTNKGTEPVTLTQISASCGCTVPSLDQRTYAPGERGEIRSIYAVGERQGIHRSVITVHTDAPRLPVHTLTLTVDIPVPVQVLPRVINWRVGEAAVPKEITVVVHPELDLTLTEIIGANGDFAVELHPEEEQGRYRLIVTPASTAERTRTAFFLHLDPAPSHPVRAFALIY